MIYYAFSLPDSFLQNIRDHLKKWKAPLKGSYRPMGSGNILFHTLVSGKICFESHGFWITQSLQECIHCIKWTHSEDIITFSQKLRYPNALGSYISHYDLHFESWRIHQSPMTSIIMSHLWWYWGKSISWFVRGCCYLMQQLSSWHAMASSSPTWTTVSSISMPTWGVEIESQGLLWGSESCTWYVAYNSSFHLLLSLVCQYNPRYFTCAISFYWPNNPCVQTREKTKA